MMIVNSLRPRRNGRYNADDIFKCIFLKENVWNLTKIPLMFVPKGPINNIPALVQIMAWRRPGDKPLSEPMMVSLLSHICVTRPQWVKVICDWIYIMFFVPGLKDYSPWLALTTVLDFWQSVGPERIRTYIRTLTRDAGKTRWRHHMERLATLLILCERNPSLTGGFPSQRTNDMLC